jgi:GDP-mannose 6-dehydrogenase
MGYVGVVTAACFAHEGHEVVGVDVDPAKLEIMRSGQSPIVEEGLAELIGEGVRNGRIRVTHEAAEAIGATEASLVCVGTPSRRNGSLDMAIVCQVAGEIGTALAKKADHHLVIFRSTVLPGTVNNTLIPILEETSGRKVDLHFDVCFNPEFLRESTSVKDFYDPPFTVVGVRNSQRASRAATMVQTIYEKVQAPFLTSSIEAAEMIKCASNTFHALKVVFANEIGSLCKALKIDSHEVMRIFCLDTKLNVAPLYLKPGFAFGGSCLPKDLRALEYQANALDLPMPLIRAIIPSNILQIERALQMVLDTGKKKVGLLGLSFKPGTDDLRESPLVVLAEQLLGKGFQLKIYDDNVSLAKLIGANKRYITHEIPHLSRLMVSSLQELFDSSEVVVVGNKSDEFAKAIGSFGTKSHTVIDLVRIHQDPLPHVNYQGICW